MSARRPASQADRARAFGDHIRRLRKGRKLSQRQVAETIPMSPGNLSRIEAGNLGPPSDEVIEALAKALGADRTDLFHVAGRELDRASFQRQVLAELEQLRESVAHLSDARPPMTGDERPGLQPETALSFEGTLSALLGFIGRKVAVGIGDVLTSGPGLMANLHGTLARGLEGRDTGPRPPADESGTEPASGTLYFHLEEEPSSGFFLQREHFRGAWWDADDSGELIIVSGGLRTSVSASRPRERKR
jgi:transcriptional regulator with XRE-family HTH domain